MGDFSESVDDLDLVDGMYRRRQATVYTKDLVVDDHGESKEVEHVCEIVPNVGVAIFAGALGIEAIGLSNAARLMIATDKVDTMWIAEF